MVKDLTSLLCRARAVKPSRHTLPLFVSDDSFEDMAEYEASLKGEDALRAHCEPIRLQMLEACIAEELAAMPEVDRKALQEAPGLEEFVEQSFRKYIQTSFGSKFMLTPNFGVQRRVSSMVSMAGSTTTLLFTLLGVSM